VGKPLRDELEGFHSFRAKRFRIVYQIRHREITVVAIAVGPRETLYEELTAEAAWVSSKPSHTALITGSINV